MMYLKLVFISIIGINADPVEMPPCHPGFYCLPMYLFTRMKKGSVKRANIDRPVK